MTRTFLLLSVGWVVAGAAAPARAGIIHTTFDPGLTYPESFSAFDISDADGPFGYVNTAVPFSTPSGQTALRLDRVYSVSFGSLAANPIYSLALYASTGGPASTPAQQIAVLNRGLHRDDFAGSSAVYRHTPGGEVLLDPNTEYWLVGFVAPADAVPGLDSLWFIHDSNLPAHSIASRFAPNDPWSRQDFPADFLGRPLFQVEATAIPEPATLTVLVVVGLAVVLVRRVRRPLASV